MANEQTQWFRTTNGVVWGILALVVAAVIVILDVAGGWHLPVLLGALLFAAVSYVAMIRPRIGVQHDLLILDHMFSTVRIPVAAVDAVAVGRTFEATAGGRSYVSAAVSRSMRESFRGRAARDAQVKAGAGGSLRGMLTGRGRDDRSRGGAAPQPLRSTQHEVSYADFVVQRIQASAADARARAGIAEHSPEQGRLAEEVRRTWAWPEVAAVAVLAVALVVSLLV